MECRELTEYALGRLTGEASSRERDALQDHVSGCESCRTELASIEETWQTLGNDPDAVVTPEYRVRTLALLEDEVARRRIREFHPRSRVLSALGQAAAILLAAAAGFLVAKVGARSVPTPSDRPAVVTGGAPASLDFSGNPRLTNVSYKTDADGRVGITFDSTTRHSISGRPDDPRVSSLLAYLLSRDETAGEKSRAIELVSGNFGPGAAVASPEIVGALASFRSTPQIRAALLDALANDPNPGVRLVAVDALAAVAREAPDPKTIQSLREKAFDPSENGFVRARAASALKAIDL
jgi:HEAT repeat protein/putative zinc finger protein